MVKELIELNGVELEIGKEIDLSMVLDSEEIETAIAENGFAFPCGDGYMCIEIDVVNDTVVEITDIYKM